MCPTSTIFLVLILSQLEESATGLQYLHTSGLVHGDLRPVRSASQSPFICIYTNQERILITDDEHACLANVGHASLNREQGDSRFGSASVSFDTGNTRYSPPEYFADEFASKYVTRQGDIYTMGMTIYEVSHSLWSYIHADHPHSTIQGPHRQETVSRP